MHYVVRSTLLVLFLVGAAVPASAQPDTGGGDRLTGPDYARSPVVAEHGIAATSQPLASQIAVDVLQEGGSAVDAAIAANAALGLMEPTGNGLGGDLFALVYDPETDSTYGLNASGRSPQGLSYDELQQVLGDRDQIPLLGHLPVSVPGTASGWGTLHERFGQLPLDEDLAPAIEYAREGFPLSQVIAYLLAGQRRRLPREQRHAAGKSKLDGHVPDWGRERGDARAGGGGEDPPGSERRRRSPDCGSSGGARRQGSRSERGSSPLGRGPPFTTRHEQPGLGRQQIERLSGGGEPCERSRRGSPDAFAGSHDEVSLVSCDRLDGRL